MTIFRKINDGICKVEGVCLVITALVLILSITIQVVCRYVLKVSTPWAEELARFMFVWMAFIGGGYCTARREHIEIGLINKFLDKSKNPEKINRIWFYMGRGFEAAFLIIFAIIYIMYLNNISKHPQVSTVMGINMNFVYYAAMVGTALMIIQGIILILDAVFSPNVPIKEVGK